MTLFELRPSPRHGPRPQLDHAIWPLSAFIDELGRLCVGEVAVADGRPRTLVRRETIADLLARDCDWSHPPHRSGSVTMGIDKAGGNRHV